MKNANKCFNGIILIFIAIIFALIFSSVGNVVWHGTAKILEALKSKEIQFAIRLSFVTASVSTLLCFVFAVPIAYGLERFSFPGKRLLNTIIDIPMSLPPIVSGFALLILFGTTEMGKFLADNGLKFVFTVNGIMLAQFFVNIPYLIRILKSTIADIDPRLEFIARTLGCSKWQVFTKVTLPLAKNGLFAGLITTWARAIGEFGASLMLAGATRMKTEILPVSLYLNLATGDLELAMAVATILIIFSVISLVVFELLINYRSYSAKSEGDNVC